MKNTYIDIKRIESFLIKEWIIESGAEYACRTYIELLNFIKKNPIDAKFKEKWIKALTDGSHKQANGYLFTPNYFISNGSRGYCCIGVAGSVCGISKEEMSGVSFFTNKFPKLENVPIALRGETSNPLVKALSTMNDNSNEITFRDIAFWIQERL